MIIHQSNYKSLQLTVSPDSIERFTTLLQSGISFQVTNGVSLGVFLDSLPEFTMDYIVNRVQTIFLDGNAIDDLQSPLTSIDTVIAISAAMPGLAGAIFRKNSLHAALRTSSNDQHLEDNSANSTINVTLKLFNMIAQERGKILLETGVDVSGKSIVNFLSDRTSLFSQIHGILVDEEEIYPDSLLDYLDTDEMFTLTILKDND